MSKPRLIYFDAPVSRGEECRLALHLASDESGFTTGQIHIIDGGWMI